MAASALTERAHLAAAIGLRCSMDQRPTTLERAFQLARSGECRSVTQIRARLMAEGAHDVQGQLYGMTIRNKLREAMKAAAAPPRF